MSTYRLPLPMPTHSSWLQRALQRVQVLASRAAAPRDSLISDWYELRDLPAGLQRDIGVPESLREHGRQLRERDALWLHI